MNKPLTLCCSPGCNDLTGGRYCVEHQHDYDRHRGTVKQRGYSGREHREFRRVVLNRDPWCVACRIAPSTDADHIVPLARGGTANPHTNGQGLCKPCHSLKTANEQRGEAA